ncbi:MAG: hypothetical protein C4329_04735 [Chitinophagaceae bacterium]
MKTLSVIPVLVILILTTAAVPNTSVNSSVSKYTDDFSFIRGHRQGKGATISWGFNSANATAFTLQRTYEDPSDPYSVWEAVSNFPCNGSRQYRYTDSSVFPGFVNYRVIAAMADGSTVVSTV